MHFIRLRRISDEFNQLVPKHHLARRRREIATQHKVFGARRRISISGAFQIVEPKRKATLQIPPAFFERPSDNRRIRRRDVCGRGHVEQLTGNKTDDLPVVFVDARGRCCRTAPPILRQKKSLRISAEWLRLPEVVRKPVVSCIRLNTGFAIGVGAGPKAIIDKAPIGVCDAPCEFALGVEGFRQMQRPVHIGERQRRRRNAAGRLADRRIDRSVQ